MAALPILAVALLLSTSAPLDDLWKDPEFQRELRASYATQSDLEPKVTTAERQVLESFVTLMATDPAGARAALERATTPESSAVFDYTLGNLDFQNDALDDAAAHYKAAVAKFPTFRRAWKNLGLIAVRQSRSQDAVRALSRVVELGGADGLTYGLLGYAYAADGIATSAESAYRNAVLLQPDVLDWKVGLTQSVLKQRKYGEAAALCEELIAKYPDRAEYWLIQANAYLGLNQPLRAAEDFEIVQRMGKATPQSLYTLGDIYTNEGLYDLAARAYRNAIDLDTEPSSARPMRGIEALAQRGATARAKELADHLRETRGDRLDGADAKKLLKLEARIAVAAGGGESAVKTLEEIVALDPLDGEALVLLGQHYARANDPERAIFYYERAESIEGFEADARLRHAQVLVAASRFQDAVPLLKRVQELKPREDVSRYLEQVERLARAQR
ncbi:MAG TPA: tetratricopeptide repeat protein [Candidatus Polarisedimenticolaceae bacterium]|nr:tetratricopeptide repeat protein [Candidatus Polarisedimenticolaceae bacterium]